MSDGLTLVDFRADATDFMLRGIDPDKAPHYTISEVAKFFFGRTASWMRWREHRGYFILDAKFDKREKVWVPARRSKVYGQRRTEKDARLYNLEDVEGIAHAMAQKHAIDGVQLVLALRAVIAEACIFGHLPSEILFVDSENSNGNGPH